MNKFSNLIKRTIHSNRVSFSYIGRSPINIPNGVTLEEIDQPLSHEPKHYNTTTLKIKGPLGELQLPINKFIKLEYTTREREEEDGFLSLGEQVLNVKITDAEEKKQKNMWGTTRTLIHNCIEGVTDGYHVPIKLVGVGYRAQLENYRGEDCINLKLGYTHPINIVIPKDIKVTVPNSNRILLFGIDKQRVFQFAAKIRAWRKPEPYNLKGVFVGDETIKKKEIKKK